MCRIKKLQRKLQINQTIQHVNFETLNWLTYSRRSTVAWQPIYMCALTVQQINPGRSTVPQFVGIPTIQNNPRLWVIFILVYKFFVWLPTCHPKNFIPIPFVIMSYMWCKPTWWAECWMSLHVCLLDENKLSSRNKLVLLQLPDNFVSCKYFVLFRNA